MVDIRIMQFFTYLTVKHGYEGGIMRIGSQRQVHFVMYCPSVHVLLTYVSVDITNIKKLHQLNDCKPYVSLSGHYEVQNCCFPRQGMIL